tara:strand:+ start:6328 stop:8475 length:2148 start_codon:yes stop_codon:yes gene_type:complete
MNNRKSTFWSLLERGRIVIPQIQRDYAYGRDSNKAAAVRHDLLTAMFDALNNKEHLQKDTLVLDFIYGSILKDKSMTPIDGQQRLTTLFLLHLYASIEEGKVTRKELLLFCYETRHSANEFCKSLVNDFTYDLQSETAISDQIQNQAKFLNSYDDDPTIQSMLVVLDDIHRMFSNVDELWEKLTTEERIIFYYLDLEKFGLTDDLYIKMNSRGKSLTRYEIFKSAFEKFLEEKYPTLKEGISNKLDVQWTNMLWKEDCEIDEGFLNLFHNIFSINYYLHDSQVKKIEDADKCFREMLSTEDDLNFFINFLDAFYKLYHTDKKGISEYHKRFFYNSDDGLLKNDLIRVFWQSKDNLFLRATSSSLGRGETIMFYALAISLQNEIDEKLLFFRFRQLRNLISNSPSELRPENIHEMLLSAEKLILNGILPCDTFNQNQINEENTLEKSTDIENKLLYYENHEILRGSLGLFMKSKPHKYTETLDKFVFIFDDNYKKNTPKIRQALLSIGDYSQQQDTDIRKRFLVHRKDAWRSFFTINRRRIEQEQIIHILDTISISDYLNKSLETIINDYLLSEAKDWKYYFIKYDNQLHYESTQGYYYWNDRDNNPLEIIMLNSSYQSASNLEWNIFNWILYDDNKEDTVLDFHGAAKLILFKAGLSINAVQTGFQIEITNEQTNLFTALVEKRIIDDMGNYFISDKQDFIEKGKDLIMIIESML